MPSSEDRNPPLASGTMTRPGRVLVVDDEPAIGRVLRVLLSREHHVVAETSASAALDRIANGERFDAILCDVSMPDASGPDLLDAIRLSAPELVERVVFMSGGITSVPLRMRVAASGRPCIEKPFDIDRVRAVVGDLVVNEDRRALAVRR
jgi:DNA-binding NtrC family response regulator